MEKRTSIDPSLANTSTVLARLRAPRDLQRFHNLHEFRLDVATPNVLGTSLFRHTRLYEGGLVHAALFFDFVEGKIHLVGGVGRGVVVEQGVWAAGCAGR